MKLLLAVIVFLSLAMSVYPVMAHEHDRTDPAWEATPPEVQEWMKTLMQPDNPSASCCGEADAYWCDRVYVRDEQTYCKITDDRPDEAFKRAHVPIGTEILIPNYKLKWDRGNPTGHVIVFGVLGRYGNFIVFCLVQSTGI